MNTVKLKKLQSATTRLIMAIALFLLCACEKENSIPEKPEQENPVENEKDQPKFEIPSDETSWEIEQQGGTITIHFTASAAWTAEVNPEAAAWMKISPNNGNAGTSTIQVEIAKNEESQPRSGKVTLKSDEVNCSITINQEEWKLQTGSEGIDDMPIEQW